MPVVCPMMTLPAESSGELAVASAKRRTVVTTADQEP